MKISFRTTVLSPALLFGFCASLSRTEQVSGTGLPGARPSVLGLQLSRKLVRSPAADAFEVRGRAPNVAGTKEVVGQIGRLLSVVTFAAFLPSGSSDCLIGGSAVSAAGGVEAVRGDTLAVLSGDHDRFGLESTATGHDVVLDVDNAVRAYLTGKTVKNQSLLHEGGHSSRKETFGSVAADQAEDAEKGHQVKQVSRKLQAGGLLGRGKACTDHTECKVGKCKGHRGQGMECRVRHADCKAAEYHNSKKHWGCLGGMGCDATASRTTLIGTNHSLKWGRCTASPTQKPTSMPTDVPTALPTVSPTESPTTAPTSLPTESPTASPSSAPITTPPAATECRFVFTDSRGGVFRSNPWWQLSEIELYNDGSQIALTGSVSNTGGAVYENEHAMQLIDGNLDLKDCCYDVTGGLTIIVTLTLPAMTSPPTSYAFWTANDNPARDPTAWTFSCKNGAGAYTTLDTRSNVNPPDDRFSPYPEFDNFAP